MTTELRGATPASPNNQVLAREIGNTPSPLEGAPGMGECFQAMLERQGASHEDEAPGDANGNGLPVDPHIRTVVLGPRIRIKTIADAAPDLDALLAFARAQGMSDAAIALIARASEAKRGSAPAPPERQGGTDTPPTGVSAILAQAESQVMAIPGVSNSLQASAAWALPASGDAAMSADTHAGTSPDSAIVKGAIAISAGTQTATAMALDIIRTPRVAPVATRLPSQALRLAEHGIGAIVAAGSTPVSTAGSNPGLVPSPAHSMPPFNLEVTGEDVLGWVRDGAAVLHSGTNLSSTSADTAAAGLFGWAARTTPGAGDRSLASAGLEVMDPAGSHGANPIPQKQELLAAGPAGNPGQEILRLGTVRDAAAMASTGSPGLHAADVYAVALVTGFAATLAHQAALANESGSTRPVRFGPVDDTRDTSGSRSTPDNVAGSDDARPSSAGSAWPSPPESPDAKSTGATRTPDNSSQDALRNLDNYRQLSLKMAEAVGQRILGMLNRGEWQLALQLNPAHLGRIDIRLTLRGNRTVDAEFLSSRSDTASLLASGESQLRAGLDGAGFNTGQISSSFDSSLDTASRQARPGSQPSGNAAGSQPAPVAAAQSERRPSSILTPERLDVFV